MFFASTVHADTLPLETKVVSPSENFEHLSQEIRRKKDCKNGCTVNGDITISASDGGIIFPDGTKQTTAFVFNSTCASLTGISSNAGADLDVAYSTITPTVSASTWTVYINGVKGCDSASCTANDLLQASFLVDGDFPSGYNATDGCWSGFTNGNTASPVTVNCRRTVTTAPGTPAFGITLRGSSGNTVFEVQGDATDGFCVEGR